jgi:hypothetical protein
VSRGSSSTKSLTVSWRASASARRVRFALGAIRRSSFSKRALRPVIGPLSILLSCHITLRHRQDKAPIVMDEPAAARIAAARIEVTTLRPPRIRRFPARTARSAGTESAGRGG